jgi:DNA-binding NarL/FixJ family response regulator
VRVQSARRGVSRELESQRGGHLDSPKAGWLDAMDATPSVRRGSPRGDLRGSGFFVLSPISSLCGPSSRLEEGVMTHIRVAIIEEHEIFRRGVASALSADPEIEVAAELETGPVPEAIDVAVVSQKALSDEDKPKSAIVVYGEATRTPGRNPASIRAVLSRTRLTELQLTAAVHAAAAGLHVESAEATLDLDQRKLDILRALSHGANTDEIARSLGYSHRTIKAVISAIQHDLNARTRAEAVAICIRIGVI